MPPPFAGISWGLPSRLGYLSPQGVLLPRVYCSIASPLWLELRGLSAWQATLFWTVYQLICHWLLPWLRLTFAMLPDAAWRGSEQRPWGTAIAAGPLGRLGCPRASHSWDALCCYMSLRGPRRGPGCGVLGPLQLFTGVDAWSVLCAVSTAS